ncbi:MAG: D-alanine--D-alanine ligase [Austwickia sp.]|nr:D-alanine--D-alanine ligase [Austwickia sp.]MBK8436941.1 D-alanine--D-alanine ligase [Austwickia sp.]
MSAYMSQESRKIRVAILFGGRSSEHAVSCATAAGVMRAIDQDRYDVTAIGITKTGEWVLAGDDLDRLALRPGQLPEVTGDVRVSLPTAPDRRELTVLAPGQPPASLGEVDVVFPLLHGPFGEDGTVQGLLELADIRYVGCGVLASAVMMDKHYMKLIFAGHGLPVGSYVVIRDADWLRDPEAALDDTAKLGWPVFVKPARAGSSMGISRATDRESLREAVEAARLHDPKVIVESAMFGREVECGVLQGRAGGPPRTSSLGEIVVADAHAFYDFEAKYLNDTDVRLSCPADVAPADESHIRELAARAFDAAGCEGLARVDFFYTPGSHGGPPNIVVNEINTMPGFTPTSMFPQMWAQTGMDYSALIDELIQLALQRRVGLR